MCAYPALWRHEYHHESNHNNESLRFVRLVFLIFTSAQVGNTLHSLTNVASTAEIFTVKKKKVKGWKDGRSYFPSSCTLSLASKCAVTAAWLHTWLQASTVSVWFYFEKIRLRPRCFVWTAGIRTSVVQGFPSSCCWLKCFFFAIIKDAVVWHRIYCRGKCTEKSHFSKLFFLIIVCDLWHLISYCLNISIISSSSSLRLLSVGNLSPGILQRNDFGLRCHDHLISYHINFSKHHYLQKKVITLKPAIHFHSHLF